MRCVDVTDPSATNYWETRGNITVELVMLTAYCSAGSFTSLPPLVGTA